MEELNCLDETVVIGVTSKEAVQEGFRQACQINITDQLVNRFIADIGGTPDYYYVEGNLLESWLSQFPIDSDGNYTTSLEIRTKTPPTENNFEFAETMGTPEYSASYELDSNETGFPPLLILGMIIILLMGLSNKMQKMNIHHGEPTMKELQKMHSKKEHEETIEDLLSLLGEYNSTNLKKFRKKRRSRK